MKIRKAKPIYITERLKAKNYVKVNRVIFLERDIQQERSDIMKEIRKVSEKLPKDHYVRKRLKALNRELSGQKEAD